MRRSLGGFVCFALVSGAASAQLPAHPAKRAELQARGISSWTPGQNRDQAQKFARLPQGIATGGTRDTQTMQYDDGTLSALPTVFGQVYGNRFALGIAGVELDTITLNSFSFYFLEDSLPDTALFIQAANPLNTMSITALASVNVSALMNSGPSFMTPVLNVVNATVLGANTMYNDTFYLGGWCLNSNTMFPINNEMIGLATNGPPQRGYTAASGTGAVAFSNQAFNAILRANVTSPNAVPVELMSFDVED